MSICGIKLSRLCCFVVERERTCSSPGKNCSSPGKNSPEEVELAFFNKFSNFYVLTTLFKLNISAFINIKCFYSLTQVFCHCTNATNTTNVEFVWRATQTLIVEKSVTTNFVN